MANSEFDEDYGRVGVQDDDVASTFSLPSPTLPVVRGWRGLAHYRTWSRRRVFQKSCDSRTQSELYLLLETIIDVEQIASLPHSTRLQKFRLSEARAKQNMTCVTFLKQETRSQLKCYLRLIIELLNSKELRVTAGFLCHYWVIAVTVTTTIQTTYIPEAAKKKIVGQQDDEVITYCPGHWFGEAILEAKTLIWEATFSTAERCEVITLTRDDYEKILRVPNTIEVKARVEYLKSIEALKEVSKQSLRRLANVLTARTFTKNRVITFQGDDAVEMFFIRSGECRVIMEIPSKKHPASLPRASSSLSQYWPTCHQKCKQEVHEREKEWWRPSLVSRPSIRGSRMVARCHSQPTQPTLPEELPKVILQSPDMIYRMLTHKKATPTKHPATTSTQDQLGSKKDSISGSGAKRPYTAPPLRTNTSSKSSGTKQKRSSIVSEEGDVLSPWHASPDMNHTRSTTRTSSRSSQGFHSSFAETTPEPASNASKSCPARSGSLTSARFRSSTIMQGHKRKGHPERRKSSVMKKKYPLTAFVRDCEEKEKSKKEAEAEFSEKDHRLWQMGLDTNGTMPAVFMSDENIYYKKKFEKWARSVINRERKLLSYDVIEGTPTPSFMPGLPTTGIVRLEKSTPQTRATPDTASKTTTAAGSAEVATILDIGALKDGQYFGERGLLTASKRAASVVAVTAVDTLVLNKWDFHRHCDRDVIKALTKHEYKKEEEIYNMYMKTRKWEMFKRHMVENICLAKENRMSTKRPVRVVTNPDGVKVGLRLKDWT